jgi:integrase/recombinase XerD
MGSYAKNWLTKKEWKKLKNAPQEREYYRNHDQKKWRDELILRLTYRGGLRINETLDLQYPYNFKKEEDNGYVLLEGAKAREDNDQELQPVGADLIRDVSNYMTAFHEDLETNFVFTINRSRAYQIINELRQVVGIEKKLGTHTLRRSRAKHLRDSGVDLDDVSDFLRHNDLSTTRDYLKISKKYLADQAKEVDEEHDL